MNTDQVKARGKMQRAKSQEPTALYRNTNDASAEKSSGAKSRARNLGYAAAAIIAALSVESGRDGKKTGTPACAASRSKVERSSEFAATPPVTNRVATSRSRAATSVFSTR